MTTNTTIPTARATARAAARHRAADGSIGSSAGGAAGGSADRRRSQRRRLLREVWWRHAIGIVMIILCVIPILYILSASLNPQGTLVTTSLIPAEISLVNYRELLAGDYGPFTSWYRNTIIVCTLVAALHIVCSLLSAYAFSRMRFAGRRFGLLALLLIMMFPQVLSMIAIYTMFTDLGTVVPAVGLNTIAGYSLAMMGGALGQVWLIKGTFDTIPRELDEAAILDGCSHWQVFWRILLPSLKPIIATTLLLAFVGVISEFIIGSLFLTNAESKTLAVGLYGLLLADRGANLGAFAAGAVLTMIPVIVLFQYLQRYIVGGVTAGAVKG